MIILGIDPGSIICGYGVVEKLGRNITLIEYGIIKAKKIHDDLNLRIKEIYLRLQNVCERCKPDCSGFESMFYSKNVQSLIKLSHARSAAILAAVMNDIPISEYSPREVKKSITGYGNASKQQVQYMVRNILKIEETPEFFDATDALAVAICHAVRSNSLKQGNRSWKDFIEQNPHKVIDYNK
jgi:crossover junction endodeoxyribonuclease RuvC